MKTWKGAVVVVLVGAVLGLGLVWLVIRDDNSSSSAASTSPTVSTPVTQDQELQLRSRAMSLCLSAVRDEFRDPASSQFRNVTAKQGSFTEGPKKGQSGWQVTGEVNSKNGFGAYSGFTDFTCSTTNQSRPFEVLVTPN